MENQFAVITNTRLQKLEFEGNEAQVYGWLVGKRELDAPGYNVFDRVNRSCVEEGVFIREFKERVSKLNEGSEHKCLSEDRIREIIREELTKHDESQYGDC